MERADIVPCVENKYCLRRLGGLSSYMYGSCEGLLFPYYSPMRSLTKETREAALSVRQRLYIMGLIGEIIIEDDCWFTWPTDVRMSE